MLPSQLTAQQFANYPPQAKLLCLQYLYLLKQLPLGFLPNLLRELMEYDYAFPAERLALEQQLTALAAFPHQQLVASVSSFSGLKLPIALQASDWVNQPAHFTEELAAYLWASHQTDSFRAGAIAYNEHLATVVPAVVVPVARLGVAVIGQGVASYDEPLFLNLRRHGTYFSNINPDNGLSKVLVAMSSRANLHPLVYGHWYVDGGTAVPHNPGLTTVSYAGLANERAMLLKNIDLEVQKPGMGPEELRSYMMRLSPADLNMCGDTVLDRFKLKLLTEGSGTQIFSTTFAQWAGREVLRRAQPLSLLVRYAPRQRQRPMNKLFSSQQENQLLDATGSLVDGDMGAYYQWIDQQRLPKSFPSSFIVWFEGHRHALAISSSMPKGVESKSPVDMASLIVLTES